MSNFSFKKHIVFIILGLVFTICIGTVFALDANGTADINLGINLDIETSNVIIGDTFDVDITLSNNLSSDGDAYNPGILLNIPDNIIFVSSADLGSPTRIINYTGGSKTLIFKTNNFIVKGTNIEYSITLRSDTDVDIFTDIDIKAMAYVEDNVYGRGGVPSGAPVGTLSGWVDLNTPGADPTDKYFPANVDSGTDLSTLPFQATSLKFVPYNITKESSTFCLIGDTVNTTITVHGNAMGALNDFHIQDVLPQNRKFIGFTTTGAGNVTVQYNTPTSGQVTLDLSDIDVAINDDVEIIYNTLCLAFPIENYNNSGDIILDRGTVIHDRTSTINTATMLTGGTRYDGSNNVPVTLVINPQTANPVLSYAHFTKRVNNEHPVIGDTITYTLQLNVAENIAFDSAGSGTYIKDILPDGLTFLSTSSSTNGGLGDTFQFVTGTVDANGDTTIIWKINSGDTINGGDDMTITYSVLVDGAFEGGGDMNYENNEDLINTGSFYGTIADNGNSQERGYTDLSLVGTHVAYTVTETIIAPEPTSQKWLVSVEFPDGSLYNALNPLPANTSIPVGSHIKFAAMMDFPNVFSTGAVLTDMLPIISGPNEDAYDIQFQITGGLQDIEGSAIPVNDDNKDGTADNSFNGLTLGGTTPADSAWIQTSPANNIEFHLGNGTGEKTFVIVFTVDVLPISPSGYDPEQGLPQKNLILSTYQNDLGSIGYLDLINVDFDLGYPGLIMEKTISGTNIEAGNDIEYSIKIENIGEATAYIDEFIDTIPDSLVLQNYNMVASGFVITSNSIQQSGNNLIINFNTGAALGRSELTKNTSIVINYTLQATGALIINLNKKTNTVALDYYSTDNATGNDINNFGPIESEADFVTKQPTITRNLISSSETGSAGNNIEIGEEMIFETIITLPGGTYTNASFTDTYNNNLEFITGYVVSNSGDINFSGGTGFINQTANFGTIVNSNINTGTEETIIIYTKYRSKSTSTVGSKNTRGIFIADGSVSTYNDASVTITTPNILQTTSVSPNHGDAGDTLTYTITLTNNGTANAYGLTLKDILNDKFTFETGTLVLDGFTGSVEDFFGNTGANLSTLIPGAIQTITFQVIINDNIAPGETIQNTSSVAYSSLTAENSPNEKQYGPSNSIINFTVDNINIVHELIGTDNPDTGTGQFNPTLYDVGIGEHVYYRTTIISPEAVYTGMVVEQTAPTGFKFLTGSIGVGLLSHSSSTIVIGPDNKITYTLGDISNPGGSGNNNIILLSELVIINATAGQEAGLSTMTAKWQGNNSAAATTNLDIVEPGLTINKDYSISTGDAGDIATTTITITNNGTAPVYDITRNDIQSTKTTSSANYTNTSGANQLNPGDSIQYNYTTTLNNTVTAGEILIGTATVVGYSAITGNIYKKQYSHNNTDSIQIVVADTLAIISNTPNNVAIGDTSSYSIRIPIGEGITNTLSISDLFSMGIAINTGSINISHDASVTYAGSDQPIITATGMYWNFTGITNIDTDNTQAEYITITFDAVALNTIDNNNGDTKTHTITALYNGTEQKTSTSVPKTIIEPNIGLQVSNIYTQANDMVKYTFTITNTGTATGYDLDLQTILPAGITYTGNITITNSGNAINVQKSGDDFVIDQLPVNNGNPLTFEVWAIVDDSHNIGDILTLNNNLTYTSQAGAYQQLILSNPDNVERSGGGGINDYQTTAVSSFVYQNAILNETIVFVDDNGGDHLGNERYTYTVTLTNSGNVNLTNITTSIDMSEFLSGSSFNLQSIPGGSASTYSNTGGSNNNGQLIVSGMDLTVGQSSTIVYKIKTNKGIANGIMISSTAIISDTPEGGEGGSINVDFTISSPDLHVTSNTTDINGGNLYQNEIIQHEINILNSGNAIASNVEITLSYDTGSASYVSGSLIFGSGTLVDTGSIVIDEVAGTISFTIISVAPGTTEDIIFQTQAIGNIGDTVQLNTDITTTEGFDYHQTSTPLTIVNIPSSGGGGGGGGSTPEKDVCPQGDYSGSHYDRTCGTIPDENNDDTGDTNENNGNESEGYLGSNCNISDQFRNGYCFARANNITTIDGFESADPDGPIPRKHLAKMMVNFSVNVLGKTRPTIIHDDCKQYQDIDDILPELISYIEQACEMRIMGIQTKTVLPQPNFNPHKAVSRAEFGTVLSRVLRGNKYDGDHSVRYASHLQALNTSEYMNYIDDQRPNYQEIRKYVRVMLQRVGFDVYENE